jgi:hypothetical protein
VHSRLRKQDLVNAKDSPLYIELVPPTRLAELAVDAGLSKWIEHKVFVVLWPGRVSDNGQPNSNFRTTATVLSTSFRLLVAVSFLIAASILLASDWLRQANFTSRRLGGFARV